MARPYLGRLAPASRPGGGTLGLHPQGQRADPGGWHLGVMSQPQIRGSCLSLCSGRRWLEERARKAAISRPGPRVLRKHAERICLPGSMQAGLAPRRISPAAAPQISHVARGFEPPAFVLVLVVAPYRPALFLFLYFCVLRAPSCPALLPCAAQPRTLRAATLRSPWPPLPSTPHRGAPPGPSRRVSAFPRLCCMVCRASAGLCLAGRLPPCGSACLARPGMACPCWASVALLGHDFCCSCLLWSAGRGSIWLGWAWLWCTCWNSFSGFCRGFRGCCGDLRYLLRSRGARGIRWAEVGTGTRGHTRPLLPIRRRSAQSARNESKQTKTRLSAQRHAHACAKATAQRTSFRLILQQCLVETGAGRGVRAASVWAQAAAAAKTPGARTSRLGHTRSEWVRGMMMTLGRNILQPGQGVSRDMAKYLGLRRCRPRPVREPKLQRPQR